MLQHRSKYYEIAEVITAHIANEGLRPGSRLPGEIELAKICGVSRPALRRAMIVLELRGDVEIHEGVGAFVCERPNPISFLLAARPGPLEILRARVVIESGVAADAALNAAPSDLAALQAELTQLKRLVRAGSDLHAADREFHLLICKASRNKALTTVVDALWSAMFRSSHFRLNKCVCLDSSQPAAITDYENIVAAIVSRNPQEARLAMRRHLQHLQEHLSGNAWRSPAPAELGSLSFTPIWQPEAATHVVTP